MDDVRTMTREYRQYPEYSEFFSTRRVDDTGRFEDRPQRESTQVKWGGQDREAAPKTTGHGGQMTVGWNRTHSPRIQHSRRVVNAEQEVGRP